MSRNGRRELKSWALSLTNQRGGQTLRPHKWLRAWSPLICEGVVNPLDRPRVFAALHVGDIQGGDRFLRKRWKLADGTDFRSNHCAACGEMIEHHALEEAAAARA